MALEEWNKPIGPLVLRLFLVQFWLLEFFTQFWDQQRGILALRNLSICVDAAFSGRHSAPG